ncbi:MAG TPA: exodeoxyribonuclease VII large subunit [Candidatus Limnocylindrales bacterium]|nr:exodeoxyribonuclease VII large subunit [Candidatus Limnocylindrales bacterium]
MADQPSLWDLPPDEEPQPPAEATPASPRATPRILRVTDLNRRVRSLLDSDSVLADVWVEGEVSQPSYPASGHCFFTLKDANSQVRAALFREELARAGMRPEHGMNVIIHGRVRAYEPQGVYQLYVDSITAAGAGDLHARYEALRKELAAAGLFEDGRKRPIPRWPRRIGVVTSPVGAVWRDITNVLRRRYPLVVLILSPSVVQGVTAAPAIVRALQRLYAQPELDTIILARGGGSLEDLWSFNDERVVRAVADAPVPIIVGVGHESDVTLADFAADLRAPTPSAAAELATPDATQLATVVTRLRDRATAALLGRAVERRTFLDAEHRALAGLAPDMGAARQRASDLLDRAGRALDDRLARRRMLVESASATLRTLSPAATLERGYAVARTADGRILRDATDVTAGQPLHVTLARGTVDTRVERTRADGTEELLS